MAVPFLTAEVKFISASFDLPNLLIQYAGKGLIKQPNNRHKKDGAQ